MKNSIKVLFTQAQQQDLQPGRYYIAVRVKIPTVIVTTEDDIPLIGPSLDPQNSPHHTNPNVALAHTHWVIFDITDHPDCPTERTVAAADRFLSEQLDELDRVLQSYLAATHDRH